jgi:uncharacterized protein YbgA (DUF1722 family)
MLEVEPTPGGLVKFHTAHKLTLMAHSPKHYTEMGRLVAEAGKRDWEELTAEYGAQLMEGLAVMGTRGKHVNVLQHLMGCLRNSLSSEDKAYLTVGWSCWVSSRTTARCATAPIQLPEWRRGGHPSQRPNQGSTPI